MSVSYDVFAKGFLSKVKEYHYLSLPDNVTQDMIDGYMKRACAQFRKMCQYDLASYDDINREFSVEIPDDELETIIDIISEGMVVQWLKPYSYNAENYENVLNTHVFGFEVIQFKKHPLNCWNTLRAVSTTTYG